MCAWIHACFFQIAYRLIFKVQLQINQEKYLDMKQNRLPEISLKSLLKWKVLSRFISHFSQDADETPRHLHSFPFYTTVCSPHSWETRRVGYPGLCTKKTWSQRNSTKIFACDLFKFIDLKVISWHTFNFNLQRFPTENGDTRLDGETTNATSLNTQIFLGYKSMGAGSQYEISDGNVSLRKDKLFFKWFPNTKHL